jgi:hypothetical protein
MKNNFHLGGCWQGGDPFTWMPDIWGFLLISYDIKSVIDIGCGVGINLSWFKDQNLEVLGIEGFDEAIKNSVIPENVVQHDFSIGKYQPVKNYDLVISTEFVEHVEQIYEENWLPSVDSCKYFLMSHAVPGQKGHHHVNCQPSEYWIDRITARGFNYNSVLSNKFRNTTERIPSNWGRNTLLFFEKK